MADDFAIAEITKKIRKVLALAERGGTEAEAIAAAATAQKLIERYNLSLTTAQLQEEGTVEMDSLPRTRIPPHMKLVADAACLLFDCAYYYHGIQERGWGSVTGLFDSSDCGPTWKVAS